MLNSRKRWSGDSRFFYALYFSSITSNQPLFKPSQATSHSFTSNNPFLHK